MSQGLSESKIESLFMISKLNEIKDVLDKSDFIKTINANLMGGTVGIALFYFYYSRYTKDQTFYDKGSLLIGKIFEYINAGNDYHTFAGGLAGFGWLIEHLNQNDFIDCDTNEMLYYLDEYIYNKMILDIENENFDYLHGAQGAGIYFLSRVKKNSKVENYLVKLIDELEKVSEQSTAEALRWPPLIRDKEKKDVSSNLSLSHGTASIIVFLSKVYGYNIQKKKTLKLLKGAITYILQNQLDQPIYYFYFPSIIYYSGQPSSGRLAWCYGDLGVGMAIYQAGKIAENNQWVEKAIEILLHSTIIRNDKITCVVDAGLCHGTAGIAHIYNRLYTLTKLETFKTAADFWFLKTLQMAKFDDGLAGYKAWRRKDISEDLKDPGFLEGVAGIGLALISYVSDIEPAWDECLLLS